MQVVLASASPRRAELLASVGLRFRVVPAEIDESAQAGEEPPGYVARLSAAKSSVIADRLSGGAEPTSTLVVAADTTVDVDGRILEKPAGADDARRMLGLLSGRRHLVHTGVTVRAAVADDGPVDTIVVSTTVEFVELGPDAIEWYVATGEPFGKAGGYAIQGAGGALVRRVDGSVSNVIGLPLAETLALLDGWHSRTSVANGGTLA
jgi:septum formation protein